jgi:hypothetical protein
MIKKAGREEKRKKGLECMRIEDVRVFLDFGGFSLAFWVF